MPRLAANITAMALLLISCGGGAGLTSVTSAVELPVSVEEITQCEPGEIDGELNLYNWAEYLDPGLVANFEQEYGVDVVEDYYVSNEALLAKLQSGAIYDLIVPSDYMVGIMIDKGLLAPVQTDAIPNLVNLKSTFSDPTYDPTGAHSVAYQWGTVGLAVDADAIRTGVGASWALLFDPGLIAEYPSGVSLLDDSRQTLGAALKYLGYSLNTTSEGELGEAAGVIAAAIEYVVAFDSDSYDETLLAGQVDAAHGSSKKLSGSFSEAGVSDTFTYVIPEEGAAVWIDAMAVPKNADHPCTAFTFIDFILDAENGATLTNWSFYASPNQASKPFIDPEILEDETIYPSEELSERLEMIEDTGDFEINYTDYFAIAKS
jgi:spermidine/putrescine-binding protein